MNTPHPFTEDLMVLFRVHEIPLRVQENILGTVEDWLQSQIEAAAEWNGLLDPEPDYERVVEQLDADQDRLNQDLRDAGHLVRP